jgi:antitoxin MazE
MHVAKWGNSLAVRLPKSVVAALDLKPGDEVEIVASEAGRIELAKMDRRTEFLDRMRAHAWPLPDDYAFDRDEANAR